MKLGRMRDREKVRYGGVRRGQMLLQPFLFLCALVAGFGLLMLALKPLDPPIIVDFPIQVGHGGSKFSSFDGGIVADSERLGNRVGKSCATVEEMGLDFRHVGWNETLRVRRIIENHFIVNGILTTFRSFMASISVLLVNLVTFIRPLDIQEHVLLSLGSSVLLWSIILLGAVAFGERVARTF